MCLLFNQHLKLFKIYLLYLLQPEKKQRFKTLKIVKKWMKALRILKRDMKMFKWTWKQKLLSSITKLQWKQLNVKYAIFTNLHEPIIANDVLVVSFEWTITVLLWVLVLVIGIISNSFSLIYMRFCYSSITVFLSLYALLYGYEKR